MKRQRLSHKDYIYRLREKCKETKSKIEVVGIYKKMHDNLEHKCLVCGTIWSPKPYNILNAGNGCPKCAKIRRATSLTKPLSQHLRECKDSLKIWKVLVNDLDIPTPRKIPIKCKECGHKKQVNISFLKRKVSCIKCSGNLKKTTKQFISEVKKKFDYIDNLDFSKTNYVGANTKLIITCKKHGDFSVKPSMYLHKIKGNCPKCSREYMSADCRLTQKQFLKRAKKLHPNKYTYEKTNYITSHTPVTVTCKKHGDFSVMPYNFVQINTLTGCPLCSKSISKPHEILLNELKKLGIKCLNNRRKLEGKEIDIWIPDYKLGIEINGVYWHRAEKLGKLYHQEKSSIANNKNITLLHFWDFEIYNKLPIVVSMIKHKLKLSKQKYARELSIDITPDKKEVNIFLENNHLQGKCAASINYVLRNKNKIYEVATFRKPRFDIKYDWELIRLATRKGYSVVGGASRLLSNFMKNNPGTIISYANNLYSDGNVYKQLGFKYKGTTNPGYLWVKGDCQLSRYQCQKAKLKNILENFNPELSEDKNMKNNGYIKVYDAGHHKFVKKILDSRATV